MRFLTGLLFFALSVVLQYIWIKIQNRIHLTQQQKAYGVNIDTEIKAKTPSMGGVVFMCLGVLAVMMKPSWEALLFWSLPVLSGAIGFLDDWLKFRSHTSEGFSSLAKLRLQLLLCGVWVILVQLTGRMGLWPGVWDAGGWLAVPVAFLMTAGTINAVNITDGLDGLAGGCFMISLAVMMILIPVDALNAEVMTELFFMTTGFMFYNTRPAKTFMGDTGSHFLGGALAALCVMNGRTLAIIPAGCMFIIEMLSSAIQIFTIHKFNKRVFLMAPLHHHYQKKGWDESAVTLRFWLVHAVGAVMLSLLLLTFGAKSEAVEVKDMKLMINDSAVAVEWEDNESVNALAELLPLRVEMHRYGGFEQVGELGRSLPRNDERITTSAGDGHIRSSEGSPAKLSRNFLLCSESLT